MTHFITTSLLRTTVVVGRVIVRVPMQWGD